ncbi:MAG: hypothetical protein HC767_02160 [Akkermansiaceae bacterium]|nr:hypothetical protein [Akkermansiaceae bacterium]
MVGQPDAGFYLADRWPVFLSNIASCPGIEFRGPKERAWRSEEAAARKAAVRRIQNVFARKIRPHSRRKPKIEPAMIAASVICGSSNTSVLPPTNPPKELGWECFMFNEHHFLGYGGLVANPAVLLSAAAARSFVTHSSEYFRLLPRDFSTG